MNSTKIDKQSGVRKANSDNIAFDDKTRTTASALATVGHIQSLLRNPPDNILDTLHSGQPDLTNLLPLKNLGVCCQKIDEKRPTLKSVLYRLLDGRIEETLFSALCGSFESISERYLAILQEKMLVSIYTTQAFARFLYMAVPVSDSFKGGREATLDFKCLYTDDMEFNCNKIPFFTNEAMYGKLTPQMQTWYHPKNTYLLEYLSEEVRGSVQERVREYLLYIPQEYIKSYV